MLIQNIALVPEAGGVTPAELLRVSAALQKQVGSHFGPCWGIQASVDPFLELEQVPAGYMPIILSAPENAPHSLDISLDSNGQPYARVSLNAGWSLAASRACLELLLNPHGQRTVNASSPRTDQGPAEILVEACGAFGEMPTAYAVNDVAVSDFCTPAFFRAQGTRGGESYSFRGGLTAPLSLLRGGHLAWFDAISNSWWLRSFHDENPADRSLGPLHARGRSLRELILRHEPHGTGSALSHEPLDARIRWQWLREQASAASVARAQRLRMSLGLPLGTQQYDDEDDEETVAMALSAPRFEPSRSRHSSPPPLPDGRGGYIEIEHRLEAGSPGTGLERERGNLIFTTHERHTASVFVETRDAPVSQAALERRDTLPPAQLLPPDAPVEPSVQGVRTIEPAPAVSAEPRTQPPTTARSVSTERPVVHAAVSQSSIPPIAMLAEPARNETSRTGLMIAAAGASALLVIAIMSGGTRSAAHTAQAPGPKAPLAAAKPAEVSKTEAAPAPIPAPLAAPAVVAETKPVPAPPPVEAHGSAREPNKPERTRAVEHTTSSEASREREEAREKRRQRERPEEIAPAPTPADVSANPGQRTAAIENLFDTRR
jgi:hypothetical protein